MSTSRSTYERKPEVRLKRYIKNHDPSYIKKRKEYSMQPDVKQRRHTLNKRRRQLCSILIAMAKQGVLKDKEGNTYKVEAGRLIQNETTVVKIDKLGNLHLLSFETRFDLERDELDEPVLTEADKKFVDMLEKYHNGDLVVERVSKDKVHISVNEREPGYSGGESSSSTSSGNA